jgi:hypothetical protein
MGARRNVIRRDRGGPRDRRHRERFAAEGASLVLAARTKSEIERLADGSNA